MFVQYKWNEDRDVWWHDIVEGQSTICPPEWMDAEDPLFMLYTRFVSEMYLFMFIIYFKQYLNILDAEVVSQSPSKQYNLHMYILLYIIS